MTISNWLQLATVICTMVGGFFVLVRYINSEDSTIIKDTDTKIGRMYGRLDDMKDKFVQKDMCKVLHEQTASNLEGSEKRSTERFDKLEQKINQILDLLMKK